MRALIRKITAAAVVVFAAIPLGGCSGIAALDPQEFVRNVDLRNPDLLQVTDGSYKGEYTISAPPGTVVVNRTAEVLVHIEDAAYREVTIRSPRRLKDSSDFSRLADRVVQRGTLKVDTVSGATYSSLAVLKAIEKAVER